MPECVGSVRFDFTYLPCESLYVCVRDYSPVACISRGRCSTSQEVHAAEFSSGWTVHVVE